MFSDDIKIHEARYANTKQDSVIVLFSDEKDPESQIQETEIEVNEKDVYFKSLLTKITIEDIVDMTAEYKRINSLQYNKAINDMVTKLATELFNQQVIQVKKEAEEHVISMQRQLSDYKKSLQREKQAYKEALHNEKEAYNKKLTETLIAEKDMELDRYRNQINNELNQQYKELAKIEAELLAKDMLGLITMQEEKKRLLEEKEELQKSVEKKKDSLKKHDEWLNEKENALKKTENALQKHDEWINEKENVLLGLDQAVKIQTNKADSVIFDFILDKNYEKEELFKFKLWALELDSIKKADKSIKSKIRKAPSIIKAITILDQVVV